MIRSFSDEPVPELILAEEMPAINHGGELEAGQSVRFGAKPPPQPATSDRQPSRFL